MNKRSYFHNSTFHLYLADSQIPDAGLGVFTKDFIPAGTYIDEYCGEIYSFHPGGSYVFEFDSNYYIDANNYPRCYMAMINDCEYIAKKTIRKKNRKIDVTPNAYYDKYDNKLVVNCETIKKIEDKKIIVVSVMNIEPDSELFMSYGYDYWN